MNTFYITLISLLFSGLFLYRLVQANPKRRRTHGIETITKSKKSKYLLWVLVFAPCICLLWLQQISAFIMWFAGLSIIGWIMAVNKPKKSKFLA